MESRLSELLRSYQSKKPASLIAALSEIQECNGFLEEGSLSQLAALYNLPLSTVAGIAGFYDKFRFTAPGRVSISLCRGTSCHLSGSAHLLTELENWLKIKEGTTSTDGTFSLQIRPCAGACAHSPVVQINGITHRVNSFEKLTELIAHAQRMLA